MSAAVTAAATAYASAATATASVQLLSGDVLEVEIGYQESYYSMYRQIWRALPKEMRPHVLTQMNLLLEGELVPMSNRPAVVSQETYHLFMDINRYNACVRNHAIDAVDMNDPRQHAYVLLSVVVEAISEGKEETTEIKLLYDPDTHLYYDLEGVEREYDGGRHGLHPELLVWLPEGIQGSTGVEMLDLVMKRLEDELSFSMSGRRGIQEQLEGEFTTVEESNPSYAECFHDGEYDVEPEDQWA